MDIVPALFNYCEQVYREMDKEARVSEGHKIYEGSLTKLVASIGLSNPYYSNITRALKAMDCIRMQQRGGGGHGSVWLLMQPPTPSLWRSHADPVMKQPSPAVKQKDQRDRDILEQLKELRQRIERLEDQVA
jgi:hypothetical protein